MRLLLPVALLSGGLAAGVLAGTVLGGVPLLRSLPSRRYVEVHQFLATRYEPFQPICIAVTLLANAALAVIAPVPATRALFALGALLAAAVMVISATRNVPVKQWVLSLDPAELPADFDQRDPRRVWANWNLARTVLAVAALALDTAAVAALL
jgi:anthrone oxygenase-like protein